MGTIRTILPASDDGMQNIHGVAAIVEYAFAAECIGFSGQGIALNHILSTMEFYDLCIHLDFMSAWYGRLKARLSPEGEHFPVK
jgi:hypothetical protein